MKLSQFVFCFAAALLMTTVAAAQTNTTFTFQGELKANGIPANGMFAMVFSLFDTGYGGNLIGTPEMHGALPVVDGKFTAELDFGAAAFVDDRWLEIEINGVPLTPRTPVTHAPYAIQTRGIFVNDAGLVGIANNNPQATLHVTQTDPFESMLRVEGTNGDVALQVNDNGGLEVLDRNVRGSLGIGGGTDFVSFAFLVPAGVYTKQLLFSDKVVFPDTGPVLIGAYSTGGNGQLEVGAGYASPRAVYATSSRGDSSSFGVYATSTATDGTGIYGFADEGNIPWGIWGNSVSGEAGHFSGNVNVVGTLAKSAGSFKIDHPLDPENKYLSHSFVESPDMMNVYNGNVITDSDGYATVSMPEWFEVLNRDFRYQLTIIDAANSDTFVLAKVVEEINNNQFRIRTSVPRAKVSWQVTGIRHDPYAEANRIEVEELKPAELRGLYRHPEPYGRTPEFCEESIKLSAIPRERPEGTSTWKNSDKHLDIQKSNQE
jgi:hypothetical protein